MIAQHLVDHLLGLIQMTALGLIVDILHRWIIVRKHGRRERDRGRQHQQRNAIPGHEKPPGFKLVIEDTIWAKVYSSTGVTAARIDRIAIVGAGFCGTLLATLLLRHGGDRQRDILLIGRETAVGRGVAYATRDIDYLLNVPAGRLSADAGDPLQFLRFAQARDPSADAEDFLPRSWYGDYLEQGLKDALRAVGPAARFAIRQDNVTAVRQVRGDARSATPGVELDLASGTQVRADAVVLALGNAPPAQLAVARELQGSDRYCGDPWRLPAHFAALDSVLILGNGLTMADVALRLSADPEHMPTLLTLSRRGLLPQLQTPFRPAAVQGDGAALLAGSPSVRRLFAACRAMARDVEQLGGDWREVVTFVRHLAPALWARLPEAEQRRFLRHVQCHWDVHRHRMPPALGARLAALRRAGTLKVNAGRIESLALEQGRVRVRWRPRGHGAVVDAQVDAVVNATGSNYAIERSTDPLVVSLLADGTICADALKLGLRTDAQRAVIGADGRSRQRLFYLGPLLRARYWEATAVTELRDHAIDLAGHLLGGSLPDGS